VELFKARKKIDDLRLSDKDAGISLLDGFLYLIKFVVICVFIRSTNGIKLVLMDLENVYHAPLE